MTEIRRSLAPQRPDPEPESPILSVYGGMVGKGLPAADRAALDIGCGFGRNTIYLARRCHMAQTIGIDIDRDILIEADKRRAAQRISTKRCRFIQADMRNLPFADDSFDVITANEVLHNLSKSEQRALIGDMQRCTKRIGRNIVSGYLAGQEEVAGVDSSLLLEIGELAEMYQEAGWKITLQHPRPGNYANSGGQPLLTQIIASTG